VPLTLIVTVLLVEELLWIVNWPVAAAAAVGSNCTSNVTARLGFKVTGNVAPESLKPLPASVAELMVTGAVPVELNVTGSSAAVFTITFPNATLVGPTDSVGIVPAAGFNCRAKLLEMPFALAVSVTVCADVIDATLTVNPAFVALAGTISAAGTATIALLLANLTV
jgi:hypothetical protein